MCVLRYKNEIHRWSRGVSDEFDLQEERLDANVHIGYKEETSPIPQSKVPSS